MKVIKRDGRKVDYDSDKIVIAIRSKQKRALEKLRKVLGWVYEKSRNQ